jgi:hypothetical protein
MSRRTRNLIFAYRYRNPALPWGDLLKLISKETGVPEEVVRKVLLDRLRLEALIGPDAFV